MIYMNNKERRKFGAHLTSIDIFEEHILPKIENTLDNYIWVDLYCGEGNLILPILKKIPLEKRNSFFEKNIFLFDVQKDMVEKAINNAQTYGIKEELARKNINERDTIKKFPQELLSLEKPIFHITNPPYLYLGYIAKHEENKEQKKYFENENNGLQDLYQIALMNDLRNKLNKMIYIIPSNFLFGASVSNRIRSDFLPNYKIDNAIIFEKKIFDFTGTNVIICFFSKSKTELNINEFDATKINSEKTTRHYILKAENNYRAGGGFEDYIKNNKLNQPLKVSYYLKKKEILDNKGNKQVVLLNSKEYTGKSYSKQTFLVNNLLFNKIKSNPFFIRTVDTGSTEGRAGLYSIKDTFGVDGIFVEGATYRTNPIQLFIEPTLDENQNKSLRDTFNKVLEELRKKTDSEFMTTYKYSTGKKKGYTRKYLGLSQAKKLLETISVKLAQ